jgi:hypothetical protein
MSETDIYKNREKVQMTTDDPRFQKTKRRRRRSSSRSPFDDEGERRRRSKNSGLRRMLHLSRKQGNEKSFWTSILIVIVVLLTLIGIWQYWYLEAVARDQALKNEILAAEQELTTSGESEDSAAAE